MLTKVGNSFDMILDNLFDCCPGSAFPPSRAALIHHLDLIEGDQDSAALTPLLKLFTVFNVFFSCV